MHWLPAGPSAQSFQSFKRLARRLVPSGHESLVSIPRRSNGCSRKLFIMSTALAFTSNGFRGIAGGQGTARSWSVVSSVSFGVPVPA